MHIPVCRPNVSFLLYLPNKVLAKRIALFFSAESLPNIPPRTMLAQNIYSSTICHLILYTHCPKNNLNFRKKTEPCTNGAEATVYKYLVSGPNICKQKPDIYRCIRTSGYRLRKYCKSRFRLVLGQCNFWWIDLEVCQAK